MLKTLVCLLVATVVTEVSNAGEGYTCTTQQFDSTTGTEIKSVSKRIELGEFSKSCKIGSCKSESHIYGGDIGDAYSFTLAAHSSKSPYISVMIMSFRIDSKVKFEGSSLAGTDYGNRIYTQVNGGTTDTFIECLFTPN